MGAITDIDGNVYDTVVIGSQEWTVQNLKTTKLNDGTAIPEVTDNSAWAALTTPGRCAYNNDPANRTIYGELYNWYAVGIGNLAPAGWRVPTDADWTTLTTYLGGLTVAGGKLKESGTTHWHSPNTSGTNEVGFSALPGGCRLNNDGTFFAIGYYGYWWTASVYDASYSWCRIMRCDTANVYRWTNHPPYGFSVRLVRDVTGRGVGMEFTVDSSAIGRGVGYEFVTAPTTKVVGFLES